LNHLNFLGLFLVTFSHMLLLLFTIVLFFAGVYYTKLHEETTSFTVDI
jgi:hypothetical protein